MLEQFWSSMNRKTGTHWAVFWQSFAFTITSSNSASSLPSKSWKYQLWKSECPKNMADMAFSRYIRETNLVPLSKLKVETHLSKPGIWNPFSFLSSHIFLLYIYIYKFTYTQQHICCAPKQDAVITWRSQTWLQIWQEKFISGMHNTLVWASDAATPPSITLVFTKVRKTLSRNVQYPSKTSMFHRMTWAGGSLRGFVHTRHILVGWVSYVC